jgi:hypothetical protein
MLLRSEVSNGCGGGIGGVHGGSFVVVGAPANRGELSEVAGAVDVSGYFVIAS